MPGIRGGAEWSGACVDMETGIMYVGINDIPNIVELKEKKDYREELSNMPMIKAGEIIYQRNCAVCHGDDRGGNKSFPPLLNIESRLNPDDVKGIITKSKRHDAFILRLPEEDKDAIIAFLFNQKDKRLYQAKTRIAMVLKKRPGKDTT